MMKWISLILLILPGIAHPEAKYPVSDIPEALRAKAHVVVREDVQTMRVIARDRATSTSRFVVTILNANGNDYADHPFFYDKLNRISNIEAAVYDANGQLKKRLRNSEIRDEGAFDGSLFSDNRVKVVNLKQNTYPYTVEFAYERDFRYLYSFMDNILIPGEDVSVQHFSYELIYPVDLKIRFKMINFDQAPVISNSGKSESLKWVVNNLSPIKVDPFGPSFIEIAPRILAAPSLFEYGGYEGNMQTWKEFGSWQYLLNYGRDGIPADAKENVRALTRDLKTIEEKSNALYNYLQGKTRYVSIQLGIGGLQPFDASVVHQNGYGDCKALSNYMVALLKEADVKAYFTTIYAGAKAPDVVADFPSHQANHAIVAVPNGKDTIWLECTSQTNPFGYLGRSTSDRYALLVTESGGVLARTPSYLAERNIQSRSADVYLEASGNARARTRTTFSGLQYENDDLDVVLTKSVDDQKKWIQNNSNIPSFDVASFTMINSKGRIPSAAVKSELVLNRYAAVSGKRLFLTPNLMNRSTYVPEKIENRKSKVIIKMGYIDYDTIRYQIPENLYPEYVPPATKFSSQFGDYQAELQMDQGKLIYTRRIRFNKGEFPAESYPELIDFYRNVNKADNVKIVFLNKT